MRYFAIAAGLAFAVSTMSVVGPAWAQQGNPGAPIGGGGSGGGNPGYPLYPSIGSDSPPS